MKVSALFSKNLAAHAQPGGIEWQKAPAVKPVDVPSQLVPVVVSGERGDPWPLEKIVEVAPRELTDISIAEPTLKRAECFLRVPRVVRFQELARVVGQF